MIKIRIERGKTIKHRNECGEPGAVFGLLSWLVVRSVPDCERGGKSEWLSARKGCGDVGGPKRVGLEEESR
jgi:hypothetical protein